MQTYINSVQKQFRYYKHLADSACLQLTDDQLFSQRHKDNPSKQTNSIAIVMQHIAGNMHSRWTNVWEEDGEKPWRNRDAEFVSPEQDRNELYALWEKGWRCLFDVIDSLKPQDLERTVYIRNIEHSLIEAVNRQAMHYAYHVGQIVLMAKEWKGDDWQTLSIPLGGSQKYNEQQFSKEINRGHFTDEWLKDK